MKLKPKITLIDHFSKLTDPRIERTKEHKQKLNQVYKVALNSIDKGSNYLIWQLVTSLNAMTFANYPMATEKARKARFL
jgi:hypothetical protein